jgi:hypothetical protein
LKRKEWCRLQLLRDSLSSFSSTHPLPLYFLVIILENETSNSSLSSWWDRFMSWDDVPSRLSSSFL